MQLIHWSGYAFFLFLVFILIVVSLIYRDKLRRKALVRLSVLVALAYGAKRTLFD
jgi:hypothetical protein